MKNMIFFILFLVACIECNKFKINTEICFPKEEKQFECLGIYNYNCGDFVCAKTQYSCQMLSLFSGLKGEHIIRKYKSLVTKIKICPEPAKYKWKTNDVCFNSKDCVTTKMTIWSFNQIKQECKCKGKYRYKCSRDHCALDKLACDGLKKNAKGIKKCL